jgi:8-oxo-dGTP diphosphatase
VADHPRIEVTVDAVVVADVEGEPHVLVVRRGNPPFEGRWALPGGFLEPDEELAEGAARELREETGVQLAPDALRQLGAYGTPGRDPRGPTVSIAFAVRLDEAADATGGDDAAEAQWRPVAAVLGEDADEELAFDHAGILGDGLASLA